MNDLPLSAIVMLVFVSTALYGSLAYFLYKAMKNKRKW